MNRQIRGLAVLLVGCFTLLFVQVNLIQVGDRSCAGVIGALTAPSTCRDDLDSDPLNRRAMLRDFTRPRGAIVTADGVVIAKSVDSHDHFVFQRVYPEGELYGHITGYYSFVYGSSGLERTYNDVLAGQTLGQQLDSLSDLFSTTDTSGNVTITVRDELQRTARAALGDRRGSVVALDPRNGDVLAMWSNPSYDPNVISHHDTEDNHRAREAKNQLAQAEGEPLRAAAVAALYQPGSTFKLVTGSIGVDIGKVTAESPRYPVVRGYQPPNTTHVIHNYHSELCGGTLFTILARSCNTSFAQMGVETIGPQAMIAGSQDFGFDAELPIDLPEPKAVSSIRPEQSPADPKGNFTHNLPLVALAAIGQGPTVTTPLQMALVVAAIANDGVIMTPHLLDVVRDSEANVTRTYDADPWRRAIDKSSAAVMREAMRQVVARGTATNMAIPGFDIGAKTGTAQVDNNTANNAWMVAWGAKQGQEPSVVVVAVVPDVPGHGSESTGSAVAGPVARAVLAKALGAS